MEALQSWIEGHDWTPLRCKVTRSRPEHFEGIAGRIQVRFPTQWRQRFHRTIFGVMCQWLRIGCQTVTFDGFCGAAL